MVFSVLFFLRQCPILIHSTGHDYCRLVAWHCRAAVFVSHKGITLVDHLLCVPERTEATWLTNIIFQLFYVLGFV